MMLKAGRAGLERERGRWTSNKRPVCWLPWDISPGGRSIHALVAEHGMTKQTTEIPAGPVTGVDSEPSTYPDPFPFAHADVWEGAMSSECEELLAVGTFTLLFIVSVPKGSNILNEKWVFTWKTHANDENPQGEGKA